MKEKVLDRVANQLMKDETILTMLVVGFLISLKAGVISEYIMSLVIGFFVGNIAKIIYF